MRTNFPKPITIPPFEPYKEPWEEAKEGCWIVTKKNGCTSYKKIENADYEELEYAAARCYDIVVERIMKFNDDKNGFFSASDLALDIVKGLKELAIEQKKSYTNNT
jgi:hypothetical protein